MRNRAGIALLVAVAALIGCASTDTKSGDDLVTLQVSNDTPGAVEIRFMPMFDFADNSPRIENMRRVYLQSGETKPLQLMRGRWSVQSVPDDDILNPNGYKTDEKNFLADGTYGLEVGIFRWKPTGEAKAPKTLDRSASDPIRLRGTSDFD